jgi:hypothetical protein
LKVWEVLMADSKLRIPRLALAALVLGAACGDDKSTDNANEHGDGGNHTEHDGGDGHEDDAGGGDEPDAGGGEDAGGDDGGGSETVDVSTARIQEVADDFCRQGFACQVEKVLEEFDDEAVCEADSVTYWQDFIAVRGEDCIDAQLDLYACAALLSCDETVEDACGELREKTEELCSRD